jgi:hypothetical protein
VNWTRINPNLVLRALPAAIALVMVAKGQPAGSETTNAAPPAQTAAAAAPGGVSPRAHAHNDYEHGRPLLDALDQGFCSVEADIFLVDGKLLVAHALQRTRPDRTLQSLYLDPLRARVRANSGRVFPKGPEFFLLIDFKTDAVPTYEALRSVLKDYAGMLTTFRADRVETNAVTIILSGNRPRAMLEAEAIRYAAMDGRAADLTGDAPASLIPWISESWHTLFQWRGAGPIPASDREKLHRLVRQAHEQGRRIRFWAGLDGEPLWREQFEAGVDLIITDKLAELRRFLESRRVKVE